MAEALAAVKRELGAEAVVVHTRECRVGGVMGLGWGGGRPLVEIIAATQLRATDPASRVSGSASESTRPTPADRKSSQQPQGIVLPVRRRRLPPVPSGGGGPRHASPTPAQPRNEPLRALAAAAIDLPPGGGGGRRDPERALARQLASLAPVPPTAPTATPSVTRDWYLHLLQHEVAAELADRIVSSALSTLPKGQLDDSSAIRREILCQVRSLMPPADAGLPLQSPDCRPLTLAVVGPTGVGKTTTIAKLAAAYRLEHGRDVGIITCDIQRLAAATQLSAFADVIGASLRIADSPDSMAAACRDLADRGVLLIDTPGCPPGDDPAISRLAGILDAAAPHQLHLILSTTTAGTALHRSARAFRQLRPTHLLFTKLDEAVGCGVLLSALSDATERVSFITDGPGLSGNLHLAGEVELAARIVPAR
jgi:flagellar biosynthesis protein FlhF